MLETLDLTRTREQVATPTRIRIPPTESDLVLKEMMGMVRRGKWTRGHYSDEYGRFCTIGLIDLLAREGGPRG